MAKPKRRVVHRDNLPTNLPIIGTGVWFLLLERFHAPQWLWGIWWFLAGVVWLGSIAVAIREKQTRIFAKETEPSDG